jgi:Lrp/AsnC family leucine-responsive transcriptional regulator
VEALQENARLSFAELGRHVSLSPPAVAERVRRLELAGVLTGYRASVDLGKLGLGMQALIRVAATGHECEALGGRLKSVPEILEAHRVTGTDSHIIRVAVRSVEHLEELLNRLMTYSTDSVTAIILSTPVRSRTVTRELAEGKASEARQAS